MSVEDLFRDMGNLRVDAALQHTALASITSTGPRSLGPDLEPIWSPEKQEQQIVKQQVQEEKKEQLKQTKVEKESPQQLKKSSPPVETFNCFIPDFEDIRLYQFKQHLSKECNRKVRHEMKILREKQLAFNQTLQANKQIKPRFADQIAKQQTTDSHIKQVAEQLAMQELEIHQRNQLAHKIESRDRLHKLALEGLARCQKRFNRKYENITRMLLSLDKDTVQEACGARNRQLKELGQQFNQLLGQFKTSGQTSEQSQYLSLILKGEKFCHTIEEMEESFIKDLAEFSHHIQEQLKLEEQKKQLELERQQKEELERQQRLLAEEQQQQQELTQKAAAEAEEAKRRQDQEAESQGIVATPISEPDQSSAPVVAAAAAASIYVHPTRLAFYNEINALYKQKVEIVKPLQTNEALKQYRTNCQRAINMPLNAISAVSPQHLQQNFDKIYNFFNGQPVKVMNQSITINDHPLARDYCLLLVAKKFVSQCETSISSNPQAAFPFASVIITLWKLLPDFGKIFLAYIYKESPFLVPYVIPQHSNQTTEQYLKTIGYRLSEKNEMEKPDIYLKRQTGLARLYAAVIMTPGRKSDGPAHCFGLEEGWRWLAHFVMVQPLPDVSATLMMEMLHNLGFDMWRTYGKQFVKLLLYIQTHYIPQLTAYDEGGPKTRLEMILAKFLRERTIPQVTGVLPPGFW
ncbi:mRNA export factor Gle1 [Drosophila tropicalis]|uniref:mRNA export factor Gle1 n=1 Tax=Drosophila tropicalis TaxID=46794 RepID=UPI0035AB88BC